MTCSSTENDSLFIDLPFPDCASVEAAEDGFGGPQTGGAAAATGAGPQAGAAAAADCARAGARAGSQSKINR